MKCKSLYLFIILGSSILSTQILACKLTRFRRFTNIFFNTETGETFKKGKSIENPANLINNCKSPQKAKFLVISSGIEEPQIKGSEITKNFYLADYDHGKNNCKFKNTPFKSPIPIEEKNSFSSGKKKFFLNCLKTFIENKGPGGLSYFDDQKNCEITRIDNSTASFKGGRCIFNIRKNAQFNIWATGNKECAGENFLKKNGINPQEIKVGLHFATSLTNDEELEGYRNIGITLINAMIDPIDFMPKAVNVRDTKSPPWPAVWFFPDIRLGEMKLVERNEDLNLSLKFFVNNYCSKTCKDGICTGPCFYNLPVAGELSLFKYEKDRWNFIGSGYVGGKIPAFFDGLFRSNITFKRWGHEVKDKDKFKIELNFHDPREDFLFFKKAFRKKINLSGEIPRFYNGGELSSTGRLGPSSGEFPEYGELGDFHRNHSSINHHISSAVEKFDEMFSQGKGWPPYYEKICSPYMDQCSKFGELKKVVTLKAEFVIDGLQGQRVNDSFTTEYKIVHTVNKIMEDRKSPLFKDDEKEKIVKNTPMIECD